MIIIIPAGATVEAGVALEGLEPALKTFPARAAVKLVALQLWQTLTFKVVVTGAVLVEYSTESEHERDDTIMKFQH